MKLTATGFNAGGQKFCEEHHKYYGPRNKYKTCSSCDLNIAHDDYDANKPEELVR